MSSANEDKDKLLSSSDDANLMKNRFASFIRSTHSEHLLAGLLGGVSATLILHPLDLVKVRLQVNEGTGVVANRPKYQGWSHALVSIARHEGLRGLYAGVVPNVWGSGLSWGLYFFFYQALKNRQQLGDRQHQLSAGQHMLAAAEAGALTLLLTNPIWVAKTRLCLQYEAAALSSTHSTQAIAAHKPQYRGMVHCMRSIAAVEGLRGLYRGLVPGLVGVSHGSLQFMAYEEFKNRHNVSRGQPIDSKLATGWYLTFAALSKIFAVALTYPYQVVRSRLQDQHRQYNGVVDVCRQLWRFESVYGFYKGLLPSLIRVTPACCVTFVVYENIIAFLLPPKSSALS